MSDRAVLAQLVAEVRGLRAEVRDLRAALADREPPAERLVSARELADALGAERLAAPAEPRILLTRREAARALGMSPDTFAQLVAPHVGCVRRGKGGPGGGRALRLYRLADLEAWAAENATRIADDLPRA